jgi:hypothetical protein
LQNLPDDLVLLVVFQSLLRGYVSRDTYGENNVAVFLPVGFPHDPPHRLNYINNGVPGVEKENRIEGGHIDALGQAAGIGKDPAGVGRDWLL